MSQTTALTTIAICQIIFAVVGFVAAIVLVYAVFAFKNMINKKIDEALGRIQPVVDQAKSIAEQAKDTAEKVSEKVDHIVTRAETTVGVVGDKVESMSNRMESTVGRVGNKVEDAVSPQMVTIAGIVGTAAKVAQIYRDVMVAKHGNGSEPYSGKRTSTRTTDEMSDEDVAG